MLLFGADPRICRGTPTSISKVALKNSGKPNNSLIQDALIKSGAMEISREFKRIGSIDTDDGSLSNYTYETTSSSRSGGHMANSSRNSSISEMVIPDPKNSSFEHVERPRNLQTKRSLFRGNHSNASSTPGGENKLRALTLDGGGIGQCV